jgi:hypothetical protein
MSEAVQPVVAAPVPSEPSMSVGARAVAVFLHPTRAWSGLKQRAQWWFPLLILLLVGCGGSALLQNRALVPMMSETWDEQVQSGRMTAQQVEKMEEFFASPAGYAVMVGQSLVVTTLLVLLVALVIWFGVGFVLGTGLKYRPALEVAAWASLINLPGQIIAYAEAWALQTFKGVHVGFGALLPSDSHAKLIIGLRVFLDGLGPFAIWYLAVSVLGAAALSGAPRKSVAWVMTSLYLLLTACIAAISALFAPGS